MAKPRLVVILGPTATGKSQCAVLLAQKLHSEIISGDSMLVYKEMNIATAKPTRLEQGGIVHHLIDILPPAGNYNVVDFIQQAGILIRTINEQGKLPILVGGTGLYIKALLENYTFAGTEASQPLRQELEQYATAQGREKLLDELANWDPAEAVRLQQRDVRRIIRAIEVARAGEKVSQKRSKESPYETAVFGLTMDRQLLYSRINQRVDKMVEQGIFGETRQLLDKGVPRDAQAMQSIGYRQIVQYFAGEFDQKICIEKIKQATRNFAKRQITWYKKMPYIQWLELEEPFCYEAYAQTMYHILEEKWQV